MALSSEAPTGVLLASAARTADTRSEPQTNDAGFKGIVIFFDVTADPASASVTPKIEFRNYATGEWELWGTTAGSALDAVGEESWILYPVAGLAAAMGMTVGDAVPIPYEWRLFMDAADTDSLTYSVGYQYLS